MGFKNVKELIDLTLQTHLCIKLRMGKARRVFWEPLIFNKFNFNVRSPKDSSRSIFNL